MLKKRQIIFQLLVILVALSYSNHPALADRNHAQHPILQSASELNYPPFAIVRPDGTADGFSVELLQAVINEADLEINIAVGPWHIIKQQLAERHLDVLPLVAYSAERDKIFDFTTPYLQMNGTIFVRKGETSIRSEADLHGKEVLVMRDDSAHEYALKQNIPAKLILTSNFEEAMKLLSSGKHDAILCQYLMGLQLIKKLNIENIVSVPTEHTQNLQPRAMRLSGFEQKFCFAVPEGNKVLLAHLNEGLALVNANGTYQKLYSKWFSPILPKPTVPLRTIIKSILFILLPILFFGAIMGVWYLRREVRRKTHSLRIEIKDRQQADKKLQKTTHALRERVKELNCLYGITKLVEQEESTLEEILQGTADLIPPSWLYPEITCAKIILTDQVYQTDNFVETKWRQTQEIFIAGKKAGTVEVYYLAEKEDIAEGPFLKEERSLLNAIAKRIGEIVEFNLAEEALRNAIGIINRSPAVTFRWKNDANWSVAYVSDNVETLYGYSAADFTSAKTIYAEIIHPEDLDRVAAEVTQTTSDHKQNNIHHIPYRIISKNGDIRWVSDHTNITRDSSGDVISFEGVIIDITSRKLAEDALKQKEQHLKNILETANEGFWFVDNDAITVEVNVGLCHILNRKPEEIIGKSIYNFVDEENTKIFQDQIAQRQKGQRGAYEISLCRPDMTTIPCLFNATPFFNNDGQKTGSFALVTDITELRQMTESLKTAKEAAEKANISKSEFLANMSHEIRTPMNAILGMNRLALDNTSTPEQQHYLQTVQTSAESLLVLINDILDFSKIEAGQIDLEEAPFDLDSVLQAVSQTVAIKAQEKGLEYTCLPVNLPTALVGDEYRLRQIMLNLIGNAIKFTETGGISITVKELSQNDTEIDLQFSVKDTGIGVPIETLGYIFDQFTQADSSVTRKFGGTGLGLSICKKLTELLGGEIWIDSEPGKGSSFCFTIRYLKCAANLVRDKSSETTEKVSLLPLAILLVEDNQFNRDLAQIVLENEGHTVFCAENGVEALEKLIADKYDVILMDIQMPELDGIATTILIRECENKANIASGDYQELLTHVQEKIRGKRIPIIAMTAHAMTEDRNKCLDAGMDDYVTKPFQPEEVFKVIARVTK